MRVPLLTPTSSSTLLLSALTTLAACGGLTPTDRYEAPPVATIAGQVTGSLDDAGGGPLRAALTYTIYSAALIDCVAAVEVDGPINWIDTGDEQTIQELQACLFFNEQGTSATASATLEASFPADFSIPVDTLPDPSLLSGDEDARLGIAGVLVYSDDNDNGAFDETPLGALSFIDTVRGSSFPTSEEATSISYLIYREGAVSPLWKLFEALYGCPDPAPGFSTLTISIDDSSGEAVCVSDDRPLVVALDPRIAAYGCADDPRRDGFTEPTDQGLPANSAAVCDDFGELYVTEHVDSVCPSFVRYALEGCSDLSSQAACQATYWNRFGDAPGWWPCDGGRQVLHVLDPQPATDNDDDLLFTLEAVSGNYLVNIEELEVQIELGDGVFISGAGLSLLDRDDNGVFNKGDGLEVRETAGGFTSSTPPGNYLVRVVGAGEVFEVFGSYAPVPLPPLDPITVRAEDAAAPATDGIDDLFVLHHEGGPSFLPGELFISFYVGGELPLHAGGEEGGLVLIDDIDGDGRFGPGDALLVRDLTNEPFNSVTPEVLAAFGGQLYGDVSGQNGVNARTHVASFSVVIQ